MTLRAWLVLCFRITRFAAIPLSTNSGLIGWVPHCDTLHSLIRDYRERKKILLNIEHRLMLRVSPGCVFIAALNFMWQDVITINVSTEHHMARRQHWTPYGKMSALNIMWQDVSTEHHVTRCQHWTSCGKMSALNIMWQDVSIENHIMGWYSVWCIMGWYRVVWWRWCSV